MESRTPKYTTLVLIFQRAPDKTTYGSTSNIRQMKGHNWENLQGKPHIFGQKIIPYVSTMGLITIKPLGGGFKHFFMFTPIWGNNPKLTNIFQRGWNYQLVITIKPPFHLGEYCWIFFQPPNKQIEGNDVEVANLPRFKKRTSLKMGKLVPSGIVGENTEGQVDDSLQTRIGLLKWENTLSDVTFLRVMWLKPGASRDYYPYFYGLKSPAFFMVWGYR